LRHAFHAPPSDGRTDAPSERLQVAQVVKQLREHQQGQMGAYMLAWLGFAQEVAMLLGGPEELLRSGVDLVTGYSPGDIFRLHCVMGSVMMLQSMVDADLRSIPA